MNSKPAEASRKKSGHEARFICISERSGKIVSLNGDFRKLCRALGIHEIPVYLEDCFPDRTRGTWHTLFSRREENLDNASITQSYPAGAHGEISVIWHCHVLSDQASDECHILIEGTIIHEAVKSSPEDDLRIYLIEDSPYPIMCVSADGSLVYANSRGKALFLSIAGNKIFMQRIRRLVEYSFGTGLNFTEDFRKDRKMHKLSFLPVRSRSLVCIVADDVTKERKAERELRISEKKYRSIFEESNEMMYSITAEGIIVDINQAGVKLLGCGEKANLLGRKLDEFYLIEEAKYLYREQMEKNGFVKDFEVFIIRENGEIFIGMDSATPVKDETGKIVLYFGVIRDATERIKEEQLQIKANMELTEMNRELKKAHATLVQQEKMASIGQLAAGVAHEINNPLGFVKSNLQTLERYGKTFSKAFTELANGSGGSGQKPFKTLSDELKLGAILPDMDNLFAETLDGVSRIGTIVRNLMSFSRKDRSENLQDYDLNEGIRSTLVISKNEYKYVAEVETDLGPLPALNCNGSEINQVLLNLIVNAAQAIASRKRKSPGKIFIRTYADEKYAYCEITDDGPGIPDTIMTKIFEPFFTTKPAGKGTGLGLSISYDIIRNKHSGILSVRSEPDKGSTFTISLPLSANVEYE